MKKVELTLVYGKKHARFLSIINIFRSIRTMPFQISNFSYSLKLLASLLSISCGLLSNLGI
jgi:hypothetical protein